MAISIGARADHEAKKHFASGLMVEFKERNILDGITPAHGIWLHSKMRKLIVNFPGSPPMEVDLLNMALAGDLEIGCLALIYCEVDDMSQPYHWFSAARRDWLVAQLKAHLGWP